MAINMLVSAAANVTGNWVHVEPAKSVDYPIRVSIVGTFGGDNVILEELIGGLPGTGNTPYAPSSTTGTIVQVGVFSAPQDVIIEAPMDYLRARTGSGLTGSASVFATMGS